MARLLIAGYGFLGEAIETKFLSAGWAVDKLSRSAKCDCISCDLSSAEDVANLSNMTTSNAIRTLSTFAQEGVISIDGRKIRILDLTKLERISELG